MKKGFYCTLLAILLTAAVLILPILNPGDLPVRDSEPIDRSPVAITDKNKTKKDPQPSENTVPQSDETVTFIVETDGSSLCDIVLSSGGKYENVFDLLCSSDIRQYYDTIKKNQAVVKASVRKMIPKATLDNCYTYNTVINGFSVTAPYSALNQLKTIAGVQSVTLVSSRKMIISEPEPETDADINDTETGNSSSDREASDEQNDNDHSDKSSASQYSLPERNMTHIDKAYENGYTGQGLLIAVIDDSFDTSHEVFSTAPTEMKRSSDEILRVTSAVAFNTDNNAVTVNDKIVFAYDYAGHDNELLSGTSSHGTAIAALIAGNNGNDDNNAYRSGSYDAQLALMKVCTDNSRNVSDDVFLAALDDTAKLSPDIVNISLGVPRISMTAALFTKAIQALHDNGTYIVSSAGNYSENIAAADHNTLDSSYTDYGTVSFPSSLNPVMSVGSADSRQYYSDYFVTDKKQRIEYREILTQNGETSPMFTSLSTETPYLYLDSYGTEDDFRSSDVKEKIVIVKRGNNSVSEKIQLAQEAGAAGILMISDEPLYIRFAAEKHTIFAGVIGKNGLEYFKKNPKGTLHISADKALFSSGNNSRPSVFSSYGVTADLRLKPDILAPGTNLCTACNSLYDNITGTSAAAAEITGIAAALSEYVKTVLPSPTTEEIHYAVSALMMNTAERILYDDTLYYTPRLQGAGIVNAEKAMNASAYVYGSDFHAAISMGDSEMGEYRFPLKIRSLSDKDIVYHPDSICQTDHIIKENGYYRNTLTPESLTQYTETHYLQNGQAITEITVPAGQEIEIEVEIILSPAAVIACMMQASNGFYVDGYLTLTPEGTGTMLSVPFMGYCGDWELADIFDQSLYDNTTPPVIHGNTLAAAASLGKNIYGITMGKNMLTGSLSEANLCIGKDTVKNYYDMPTAGISFILPDFYLLRDAADYTITISDSKGNNIYTQNVGTISSFTGSGQDSFTGLAQSFNTDGLKNIFSSLKEGSYTYTVSASAVSANTPSSQTQSVTYPFKVDNTSPVKTKTTVYSEKDHIYLTAEAEDSNGVQGFIFYSVSVSGGKYKYADKIDDLIDNGYMDKNSYELVSIRQDGAVVKYTYDITNLCQQLHRVSNYARTELNEELSNLKIAVRSVDYAFNLSAPVIADAIVSGTVQFTLKDQNDRPVSDAIVQLGDRTSKSDEEGIIRFTHVLPGEYGVQLLSSPQDYFSDFTTGAVFTDINHTDDNQEILFRFDGVYPEPEEASEEPPVEPANMTTQTDYFENDNSVFGLIFNCSLLVIFTTSFIISRKRRRGSGTFVQDVSSQPSPEKSTD